MRVRKSTLAMSPGEWVILNNAINQLVGSGKWYELQQFHAEPGGNHRMHGSMSGPVGFARFLYWHRAYLLECEDALREIDESITIPYWDWLNSDGVPSGLNHMPIRGVIRNTGTIDFTDADEIDEIMRHDTFGVSSGTFVYDLEVFPHNNGHNWVGGIMSNPMDSPLDPLFYMHHANIDRLWSEWQAKPGNEDKKPVISAADSTLDPWEDKWNIDNIHSISDLGDYIYSYGPVTTLTDTNLNPEILDRLRILEDWTRTIPRNPIPWPRPEPFPFPLPPRPEPWPIPPWPRPEPWPRPFPFPGPRPDPVPDLGELSLDEVDMVRMMRDVRNR